MDAQTSLPAALADGQADETEVWSGPLISRSVVRAWPTQSPSPWRPPGYDSDIDMVAGTWVVSARGQRSGSERWAVAGHLFPIKYRLLRPGVYLNVDELWWRPGHVGEVVETLEGPRRIGEGEAVLRGRAGDKWVVPIDRIEGQGSAPANRRYLRDTAWGRFRLLWQPSRRWHVVGRLVGGVGLIALTAMVGWFLTVGHEALVGEHNSPVVAAAAVLPTLGFLLHRLLVPHRSRLPVVLVLVVEAIWLMALAGLTYWHLEHDVGRAIRVGLSTFSGGLDTDSFASVERVRGAENFAIALSPFPAAIGLIGALAAGRAILRDAWDRAICHLRRFDIVVWGLTPPAISLIRDLRLGPSTRWSRTRIAAVETDGSGPAVQLARSLGVPVLVGSADSGRTLRRVSCSFLRREWTARQIVAATQDPVTNVTLAESAAAQARSNSTHTPTDKDPLWVTALVSDRWTRQKVRSRVSLTSGGAYVRTVDGTSAAADVLLDIVTGPGSDVSRPVVLVGRSPLASEFLTALDRESRLRKVLALSQGGSRGTGGAELQVIWADSGAIASSDRGPEGLWGRDVLSDDGDELSVHVEVLVPGEPWVPRVAELADDPVVILCGASVRACPLDRLQSELTRIAHGSVQLVIESDGGVLPGIDASAGRMHGKPSGPRLVSTGLSDIRLSEHALGDINAIADVIHRHFRTSRIRRTGDQADQDWRSFWLGREPRSETYRWVRHALEEISRLGFEVVGAPEPSADVALKDWEQVAEFLGSQEHQRWWSEKASRGYSADLPKDSDRYHADGCDWAQLPEPRRRANVLPFLALPEVFRACGLVLTRRDQRLTD